MDKKLLIYQVFVRNFSKDGNFKNVIEKLDYIESLGTDILYLMPISPIGEKERKGTYGSPYAIKNYIDVSSDLGTFQDFEDLVNATHKHGMKLILDMVFHHTSPDNPLLINRPEFYYYKNGKPGNRVGDWSDIIDLDTDREDCQDYLLSVLQFWVNKGVDGFRFDVASMIALSFFKKARKVLGKDIVFYAESIDWDFAKYLKETDHSSTPDDDMYPTFDYLYNYNYFRVLERQIAEGGHAYEIAEIINHDLSRRPMNVRVHCLENHDVPRFASRVQDFEKQKEWIDFTCSLYGHIFLYMGQENGCSKDVPLFEKEAVDWDTINEPLRAYYLARIQKAKNEKPIVSQHLDAVDPNTIRLETTFEDGEVKTKTFHL